MSFTEIGFKPDNLVRLDIRINGEDAPPLATIVHRDRAHTTGKVVCKKLKEFIPRQQFKIPIQACVGAKPVASVRVLPILLLLLLLLSCLALAPSLFLTFSLLL